MPSYKAIFGVVKPFRVILRMGAVIENLYHTSAAGEAWLPAGVHPKSEV